MPTIIQLIRKKRIRPLIHLADSVNPAGVKENPLRGGGLSSINMRNNSDIAHSL